MHRKRLLQKHHALTRRVFASASLGVFAGLLIPGARVFASTDSRSAAALLDPRQQILMMRHADAPGYSDPPEMRLDDCATQRNLGERGRQQAAETGHWLRAQGLQQVQPWSSPWCRCVDTARLLGFGEPHRKDFLGSFFRDPELASKHTRQLTQALQLWFSSAPTGPLILVTHQVNLSAYSARSAASGELFRIRVAATGQAQQVESLRT